MQSEFPFSDKAWCCCPAIQDTSYLNLLLWQGQGSAFIFQHRTQVGDLLYHGPTLLICSLFIPKKAGHNKIFFQLNTRFLPSFYSLRSHFNKWHCESYFIAHFMPLSPVPLRCAQSRLQQTPSIIHLWCICPAFKWISYTGQLSTILIIAEPFGWLFKLKCQTFAFTSE